MDDHIIYRLDENISFRKCSLYDSRRVNRGDCTNFGEREINFSNYYECRQHGIHLHCTTHPAIELEEVKRDTFSVTLKCPRCNKPIKVDSVQSVINSCLKLLNIELFNMANNMYLLSKRQPHNQIVRVEYCGTSCTLTDPSILWQSVLLPPVGSA